MERRVLIVKCSKMFAEKITRSKSSPKWKMKAQLLWEWKSLQQEVLGCTVQLPPKSNQNIQVGYVWPVQKYWHWIFKNAYFFQSSNFGAFSWESTYGKFYILAVPLTEWVDQVIFTIKHCCYSVLLLYLLTIQHTIASRLLFGDMNYSCTNHSQTLAVQTHTVTYSAVKIVYR